MLLMSLATQETQVSFMDMVPILPLFYKTIYFRKVQFISVLLVQSLEYLFTRVELVFYFEICWASFNLTFNHYTEILTIRNLAQWTMVEKQLWTRCYLFLRSPTRCLSFSVTPLVISSCTICCAVLLSSCEQKSLHLKRCYCERFKERFRDSLHLIWLSLWFSQHFRTIFYIIWSCHIVAPFSGL